MKLKYKIMEFIHLCKTCIERNEYIVPLFEINKETNQIEYKCLIDHDNSNSHNVENFVTNNYDTNFLIKKLKFCEKHENNRYCAWCKKCKKNICYLCIIQEKHDYELYCHYYQNVNMHILNQILKELFYIRINLPQQLKNIISIINNFELFYKLFKEDIINYQILLNIKIIIQDYPNIIEDLKSIIVKEAFMTSKLNELYKGNFIFFPVNEIDEQVEMITLYQFEEIENNNNNTNENNILEKNKSKAPFIIYYKFKYYLELYDKNGTLMNKINHTSHIYSKCEIVEYDKNLLLLRDNYRFVFLYISPNYKNYEFSRVLLLDLGFDFSSIKKIIKMNNNNICLYFEHSLHFIKFNYDIIFNKNNPLRLDARQYCEIINSKDLIDLKIIEIIPVYYDNINNKKNIKKIIAISFIVDNFDKRIYDEIYFKLIEMVNFRLKYYDDNELKKLKKEINEMKKYDPRYKPMPKESKLKMSIIIFNNLGEIEKNFEVSFLKNDTHETFLNGLKNLNFYYFHNFILLFLYYNAYQISLQNNEIISIFELKNKKIPSDRYYDYYLNEKIEINDEDYANIKQYILNNNIKNIDLKKISMEEYLLFDYLLSFNIQQKFFGFNEKYILKKIDNEEATFNDYEESRIIKMQKLRITLGNNNKIIIINNKIIFNSIVNSSIYRVLFPNYINNI